MRAEKESLCFKKKPYYGNLPLTVLALLLSSRAKDITKGLKKNKRYAGGEEGAARG